jgi:hypothetical protein
MSEMERAENRQEHDAQKNMHLEKGGIGNYGSPERADSGKSDGSGKNDESKDFSRADLPNRPDLRREGQAEHAPKEKDSHGEAKAELPHGRSSGGDTGRSDSGEKPGGKAESLSDLRAPERFERSDLQKEQSDKSRVSATDHNNPPREGLRSSPQENKSKDHSG